MAAPPVASEFVSGITVTKINTDRKQKQVVLRIDPEQGQILWPSKKYGVVFIESVREIRAEKNAAYDLAQLGLPPTDLPRFISIVYVRESSYKAFNILFPTPAIQAEWYNAVSQMHDTRQSLMKGLDNSEMREAVWEKMHWKGADTQGDNRLDFKEVEGLCKRLSIHLPSETLRKLFDSADTSHSGFLDFEAFQRLVRTLKRRPEIDALYALTCDHSQPKVFDFTTFSAFMKERQKSTHTEAQLQTLFSKYAMQASPDVPAVMSTSSFTSFLLSSDNAVNASASGSHEVTQDMTHPLSHYYISSSHNTYLIGHQLVGSSTVEGYIRALLAGCRSVELDIYDGDDSGSEPVIKHGNTLTTKIPLRDICNAIAHYAFIASPYPIIISAEVHLNLESQDKMVTVMKECFGNKLVCDDEYVPGVKRRHLTSLPSVESLREKILLKAKNLYVIESLSTTAAPTDPATAQPASIEVEEPSDTSDSESEDEESLSKFDKAKGKLKSLKSKFTGKIKSKTKLGRDASPSPSPKIPASSGEEKKPEAHPKPMMSLRLAALLVYTVGVKCRGIPPASPTSSPTPPSLPVTTSTTALPIPTSSRPATPVSIPPPHYEPEHIFSLSENKAKKMIKADLLSLVKHCQTNLVRTYPKGIRVNSSNYEPHQFWAAGCQVVALNWQTNDFGYMMNQAMFQENGRCGYVLKPPALTQFNVDLLSKRTKHFFDITVISAQQLPTPKPSLVDGIIKKNHIVDPLVEVSLHIPDWSSSPFIPAGASGSGTNPQYSPPHRATSTEPTSARKVSIKTKVIKDNGFNPLWDQEFSLPFDCLGGRQSGMMGLVFVKIVVWQKGKDDDDDEPLAVYCAPLGSLKTGFRHLPLYDSLGSQHLFTTLFVNLDIRDVSE